MLPRWRYQGAVVVAAAVAAIVAGRHVVSEVRVAVEIVARSTAPSRSSRGSAQAIFRAEAGSDDAVASVAAPAVPGVVAVALPVHVSGRQEVPVAASQSPSVAALAA